MALNKKTAIPLLLIILAFAAGGGWFLLQHQQPAKAGAENKIEKRQLYTCSMHPSVIRDRPGLCPICGMELIKKIDAVEKGRTDATGQKEPSEMADHVSLSPTQRVMANVATVNAESRSMNKEINAAGTVQYDQSRQAKVTSWVAGRIERLHVNGAGAFVNKESPVAELYSPDLVATQQEYLLAIKSRDQLKNSPFASIALNGESLVASAKQRLLLSGVRESQITELEKTGKPTIRLAIYSPFSGVVIEKMVQQGQYVNTGEVLFNIADLSRVWIEAELYENELHDIHPGQQVEIRSRSFPGEPLTGRVALIYPFLDPKTRTVKVRVEMANPGMKLKPDMFVNTTIKVPLPTAIVVPVSAVMDSGTRQIVWVESSPGMFEPREVKVGEKSSESIQILTGLHPGEKVAVSGAYLIDSESRLRGSSSEHDAMPAIKR